ncbi:MAG: ATP-dependent helicase [Lachnospiraceae bacterium]|nr:ATP-dependent helicase [Lachnospiraceae bacterium]
MTKPYIGAVNAGLSYEQRLAVSHFMGPAEILAGPGSGKTRVITARLANLINNEKVPPGSILTITFTKKAAEEMRSRTEQLLGNTAAAINFGTFHSIFFKILRNTYKFTSDNIVRFRIQSEIIQEIIESENIDLRESDRNVIDLLNEISKVKTGYESVEDYNSNLMDNDDFQKFYKRYVSRMNSLKLIDFDDMLIRCHDLFNERNEVLRQWQEKFKFILIDEFQDIDYKQYETIKMLAGESANLFVVGDDDQSIYGFRGAQSSIMQRFLEDYKGANFVKLSVNYRSAKDIVSSAGLVIGGNKDRIEKDIKANSDINGKVELSEFENRSEEFAELAARLKDEKDLSECAVLLRTNTLASLVSGELMQCDIEVDYADKVTNPYEHFIAKDILTYLKIANGDISRASMYRIMNKPYRYISRNAVPGKTFDIEAMEKFHADNLKTRGMLLKLRNDLLILKGMRPYAAVHYILHGIGYIKYLKHYAEEKNIDYAELEEKAMCIKEKAGKYRSYREWVEDIENYTQKLNRETTGGNNGGVKVLTLHASKGLEFKKVFILDVNEKIIPYKKAVLPSEIEEERRLFYVGMTRAKEELYLWSIKDNYGKAMTRSHFVDVLYH